MFEFTLSKVNMLIFVTAIAVVVIFFMNTLNDNLKTRQSYELAFKIGKEIKSVVDADSYCSIKFLDVPKTIRISEGSSLYTINYKLGLQTYQLQDQKSLIVYILNNRETEILGAFNLDYQGDIIFYESNFDQGNYTFQTSADDDGIIYDPRKVNSNETKLMIIKHIINQEIKYYIIPCERRLGVYSCKNFVCENNPGYLDVDNEISCKSDFCAIDLVGG